MEFSLVPLFIGGDSLRVYDCFTFYNEFELLELRLKALWNIVDCFVIVEADKTHTNKPKPFYFWERQEDFKEFFPKIRHLPVEMNITYKGTGDWSIENAQRNAIMYGLEDAAPDDFIFISDADEIPAPDVLKQIYDSQTPLIVEYRLPPLTGRKEKALKCVALTKAAEVLEEYPLAMAQDLHCYYFDWISKFTWQGTILTKRKNLTTPQELRNLRNLLPRIADGGWHFSYMGGVDNVINKMTSIVDGNECVLKSGGKLIDRERVKDSMVKGNELYGRADLLEKNFLSYDARNIRLPHIEEFLRKYPHFLREPEKYFVD